MRPIDRLDSDTLTGMALTAALGLGFLLYLLPSIAMLALMVYGLWSCLWLLGEVNRRRRIAREVKQFRVALEDARIDA